MNSHPISGKDSELLPWEHPSGEPRGTGICLSGGGLRAAAFSLGALETLQKERGLLYGPNASDYMAVVSGGAYVGATHALIAAQSEPQVPPPLADEAPETEHVVSGGRYLIEDGVWRTVRRFGWRFAANLAAGALLLLWTTVMLAVVAIILDRYSPIPTWSGPFRAVGLIVFFLSVGCLAMSGNTDRTSKQFMYMGLGFVGLGASGPTLPSTVESMPVLSTPSWWLSNWEVSVSGVGVLSLATGISALASLGYGIPSVAREFSEIVTRNAPRILSVLLVCFGLSAISPWLIGTFDDSLSGSEVTWFGLFFLGTLVGGLVASYVPDVVSLHRLYRDLLSRCFGIRRTSPSAVEQIEPPTAASISSLVPAATPNKMSPRLLICATANVRRRLQGKGRWTHVLPFVFSHDRSGLPGIPGASFTTGKLELGRARVGITNHHTEPEMSLISAVAMTGAAVAPSMGTRTITGLRPLFALANARLGVWLPNPLSPTRREVVEARPSRPPWWSSRRKEYGKLGPGFEALVGEFFGIHSEDQRRIYVTDGGHYDNLGLLTLLRARCDTIWCVDAYQGKRHLGRQLANVLNLAAAELSVRIRLDTRRFDLIPGGGDKAKHAVAIGRIDYPGTDTTGTLIVIKLALTEDTPRSLVQYRLRDKRFPYHPTWHQWFSPERFRNYQRLGQHIAHRALEESRSAT